MTQAEQRFWTLGAEYYTAARATVSLQLVGIYGNIYHHSIETLLKAGLSRTLSLRELSNQQKFGHHLQKLWPAFKKQFHWAALDDFDQTIAELDQFEEIRYPRDDVQHDITIQVKPDTPPEPFPVQSEENKLYQVNKHSLDHLVFTIFATCRIIPSRYFARLANSPHTREIILNDNPVGAQLLAANPTAEQLSPPLR